MRQLFVLFILMWVNGAFAQISDLSIEGQVLTNKVEVSISNNGDEDFPIHYVIAQQDDLIMRIEGDTIVGKGKTIAVEMETDLAEYHAFMCTVSIADSGLRTDGSASQSLLIPALKTQVIFIKSQVPGQLILSLSEGVEQSCELTLYDSCGRDSFQQSLSIGLNHLQTNLPTGIYTAVIQNKKYTEIIKVFIR